MNNTTIVRIVKLTTGIASGAAAHLLAESNMGLATGVTLGVLGALQTSEIPDDLDNKDLALECAKSSGLIIGAVAGVTATEYYLSKEEETTLIPIPSDAVLAVSNWA